MSVEITLVKIGLVIFDAGYLGYALREEPACTLAESFFQTCGCQEPKWAAAGDPRIDS